MNASERFLDLAAKIGGISQRALGHFFYWRDPFTLHNWTLNIIELLILGSALLALVHAITMQRKAGDPSYLAVWTAAVVYCVAMEVPIYFAPTALGLDNGAVIFVHNEFTAGAFYGRMPFYILALYPAILYPAYVLVRQRGVFERRWGLIRGSIAVGVVHHVFYEVFDHLGPQLKWWVWDYDLANIGDVTLASVPLHSQVNFSLVNPIAFALLAHTLLGRSRNVKEQSRPRRSASALAFKTVVVGGLTSPLAVILSPNLLYARLSAEPNRAVIYVLSYGVLVIAVLIAAQDLWQSRSIPACAEWTTRFAYTYVPTFAAAYVGVLAVLWAVSLPEYFAAAGGITASGAPTGSLAYATVCAVVCWWLVVPYLRALRPGAAEHPFIHGVAVGPVAEIS